MNIYFDNIKRIANEAASLILDREVEDIHERNITFKGRAAESFREKNFIPLKLALGIFLSLSYDAWDEGHASYVVAYFDKLLGSTKLADLLSALIACEDISTSGSICITAGSDYVTRPHVNNVGAFMYHMRPHIKSIKCYRTFLLYLKRFSYIGDPRFLDDSIKAFLQTEEECRVTNEVLNDRINSEIITVKVGDRYISVTMYELMHNAYRILDRVFENYVSPEPGMVSTLPFSKGMCPQISRYNKGHASTPIAPTQEIKRLIAASNDKTFEVTDGFPGKYEKKLINTDWTFTEMGNEFIVLVHSKEIYGPRAAFPEKAINIINWCIQEVNADYINLTTNTYSVTGEVHEIPLDAAQYSAKSYVVSRATLPRFKEFNIDAKWMLDDGACLIIPVPKDYKSARIVGEISPDRNAWADAVREMMALCRRVSREMRNVVTLEDATMTLDVIQHKDVATVDLHAASDLNSYQLAYTLLPKKVFNDLDRIRCAYFKIRGSAELHPMEKFLPMGSSACMEYQSDIYAALALACTRALYDHGIFTSHSEYKGAIGLVKVHGDDQTVDYRVAELLMKLETLCGLSVNYDKSHWEPSDPYREACGYHFLHVNGKMAVRYFDQDISTVFWPRKGKELRTDASIEEQLCHIQHNMYIEGCYPWTDEWLRSVLSELGVKESLPYESDGYWSDTPVIEVVSASGKEKHDWQYTNVALYSQIEHVKIEPDRYQDEINMMHYEDALRGKGVTYEDIRMPGGELYRFRFTSQIPRMINTPEVTYVNVTKGIN